MDLERPIAGCHESVNTQSGQVNFSVGRNHSIGPSQQAGVKDPVAVAFEHAEHGEHIELPAQLANRLRGRTRDRLGKWLGLFEAVKAVAGDGTFGKHDQPGSLPSSFCQAFCHRGQVLFWLH